MKLILLALAWLAILLLLLGAVLYWLYRTKRLELKSRFSLGDIATFVSVLLAIFALAFTLATQYQPEPHIDASFRQSLDQNAIEIQLHAGEAKQFEVKRNTVRLFLLLRNTGEAPLRRPVYIIAATPATVQIRCAEEFPQFRPRTEPNVCQFNSPRDVYPYSQRKIPNVFGFGLIAPKSVGEVRLELIVQSANLSMLTYIVNVRIVPEES